MSRHALGLSLSFALFSLLLPILATAGTGEIVDGKVNMSVMFTYREEDPNSWRPLFDEASRLLYNATNGQLQLGTIRLFDTGVNKRTADVWILSGHSGAFAGLLGLGDNGHIYLSQTHKSVSGPALGYFGLVHEFGHYGFGAYDEYKAAPPSGGYAEGEGRSQPNQFCTTEMDSTACVMDGGSMVIPNNGRTEFCTRATGGLPTAHNTGVIIDGVLYVNAQETLNHESCWETIARTSGLVPPEDVEPEDPPGLQPIGWQVVPTVDRLSILVDGSISMFERSERIDLAKQVASGLVSLLHERKTIDIEGEEVTLSGTDTGVIAFSYDQSVVAPLREIVNPDMKDSINALISRIDRTPSPTIYETNLENGLLASLRQLEGQGTIPAVSESIVLLSDGCNNIGGDPTGLFDDLKARGIRVYSIAVGGDANVDLMKTLADSTGGGFFEAPTEEDVAGVTASLDAQLRSVGAMQAIEDSTGGWGEHLPFVIDLFAEEFTVVLQWDIGTLTMTLTSPSGDVINMESADWRQDVEAETIGDLLYFRVSNPEAGQWMANVIPVDVPGMIHFTLLVEDENRGITVTPWTDRSVYDYPAPIHLMVEVIADVPVAGASVTARVDRPGGRPDMIILFDDGDANHGDDWAGDGVYSTIYRGFTADGTYTFNIRAVNEDGSGPNPDLPWIEDGPGPPPTVPPFTREAMISVEVQGLEPRIYATQTFGCRTLDARDRSGEVTDYVELPSPYRVDEIDLSTIRLNDTVRPVPDQVTIGDQDNDGIPDLTLKFVRAEVIDALPDGIATRLRLTAALSCGEPIEAEDTIAVIDPEEATAKIPEGALQIGSLAEIEWQGTVGSPIRYSGYLTTDGQLSWTRIFEGVEENALDWSVCGPETEAAQLLVQADSPEGVVSQWTSRIFEIQGETSDVAGPPARTAFLGAHPNPMTGSTTLRYSLAQGGAPSLEIYDIGGRLVRRLLTGDETVGVHEVVWNGIDMEGRKVPSGVYMYVFRAGSHRASGRLMLIQ